VVTASPAPAQFSRPRLYNIPVNRNFPFQVPQTAQQYLFNSAVIRTPNVFGRNPTTGAYFMYSPDVRAFNYGVNPYVPLVAAGNYQTPSPITPYPYLPPAYAQSTVAPPLGYPAAATLSTSLYGSPSAGGYGGGYSLSTGGGYGGYGGYGDGSTLSGAGYLISSYGQYLQMKEQASLTREVVRQAKLDTYKKQVQYQMWYDSMRTTYNQMRDRDTDDELKKAAGTPRRPRSTRASR